jgi:hypothetical protein
MVNTIVRCPYCVDIDLNVFKAMLGTHGGTCICIKCGHVAVPGNEAFRCLCSHCEAKEAFAPKEASRIIRLRVSA